MQPPVRFLHHLYIIEKNMNTKNPSLFFCLLMDMAGFATFAIPGIGEFGDIVWAPLSAFIFYRTFGGWKGAFGGLFNFVEEILPFTDFIPTFTIMWVYNRVTQRTVATPVRVSGAVRIDKT
jgi:hypothetical protein